MAKLDPVVRRTLESAAASHGEFMLGIVAAWSDDDLRTYVARKEGLPAGVDVVVDDKTVKLDAKEAAEVIRKDWETEAGPLSPDDRRALTFLEQVCEHLGVEANPANVAHVAHLLSKHGIQRHDPAEYPKALNTRDDRGRMAPAKYPHGHPCAGQDIVFADADDEEAWANWKPDADADHHAGPAWDEWRAAQAKVAKAKAESKAADAKANQAKADADAGHAPQEAAKTARADADKAKAAAEAAQAKVDELKTKAQAAQAEADRAAATLLQPVTGAIGAVGAAKPIAPTGLIGPISA